MYNPPPFTESREEVLYDFIRQHPLGTVVTYTTDEGLVANHIPMFVADGVLRCHFARANPQWQSVMGAESLLVVFGGAEHYITPSWYPSKAEHGKVVPTWNYTAVHVTGKARVMRDAELLQLLHDLTDANEAGLRGQWSVDDAPADYIAALMKAIVGFEIAVERIEGKWKHSQNRSASDREGVIAGLQELGTTRATAVAEAMTTTPSAASARE